MAGPLGGLGAQQYPISNTFQPGGQNGETVIRQRENSKPQENQIQPQGTSASGSQRSETGNNGDVLKARLAKALASQSEGQSVQRGSLIDITV